MCMAPNWVAGQPLVLGPSVLDNPHKKKVALLRVAMRYADSRWMFPRYQAIVLVLKAASGRIR